MELVAPDIASSDPSYGPVSCKYDKIDKRYRFSKRLSALALRYYYPLTTVREEDYPTLIFTIDVGDHNYSRKVYPPFLECCISSSQQCDAESAACEGADSNIEMKPPYDSDVVKTPGRYSDAGRTIHYLPDHILLMVFSYFHPLDLVHVLCRVCKKWNFIAQTPCLYKELRVIINKTSLENGCIQRLFKRISKEVRRLCVVNEMCFPSREIEDLFSYEMPSLVELDLGSFDLIWEELAVRFTECFPNIEKLDLEGVQIMGLLNNSESSNVETLQVLFQDTTFPHLRSLSLAFDRTGDNSSVSLTSETVLFVPSGLRELRVLRTDSIDSPFWRRDTITELYFDDCAVSNQFLGDIGRQTNLKVLSLSLNCDARNEDLLLLKPLYKLEALHLYVGGGEDGEIYEDGLINFFKLPAKNPEKYFPYNLKYLALLRAWGLRDDALEELGRSCPGLLGLNIHGACYVHNNVLRIIARCFPELIFLNLSNIGIYGDWMVDEEFAQVCSVRLMQLYDGELPNLACMIVHDTMVNREAVERLCSKRKDLILSTTENNFVSWKAADVGVDCSFEFKGDINSLMNDLCEIPGFELIMYRLTSFRPRIGGRGGGYVITRISSLDGPDRDQLPSKHYARYEGLNPLRHSL